MDSWIVNGEVVAEYCAFKSPGGESFLILISLHCRWSVVEAV